MEATATVRCKRCGRSNLAAIANYVDECPYCHWPYRNVITTFVRKSLAHVRKSLAHRLKVPDWFLIVASSDWFLIVAGVVSFLIIVLLYCVLLFQTGRPDQAASGDLRSSTQQQQTRSFSDEAAPSLEAAPDGDAGDTTAEAIARFTRWMMATWEIENPVLDVLLDGGELELYVNRELASPMRRLTCSQGRGVAELLFKKWSVELGRTASGFTMRDSQGVILLRYRYRALGLGGLEYHCGMD